MFASESHYKDQHIYYKQYFELPKTMTELLMELIKIHTRNTSIPPKYKKP